HASYRRPAFGPRRLAAPAGCPARLPGKPALRRADSLLRDEGPPAPGRGLLPLSRPGQEARRAATGLPVRHCPRRGPRAGRRAGSLLIGAVRQTGELKMPRSKKLSDEQITLLSRWVQMGAPAPGVGKPIRARGQITDEDRAWWAFQPVRRPAVPAVDE